MCSQLLVNLRSYKGLKFYYNFDLLCLLPSSSPSSSPLAVTWWVICGYWSKVLICGVKPETESGNIWEDIRTK